MAQSSERSERTRQGMPSADQLGWDDGLYEQGAAAQPESHAGGGAHPDGGAPRHGKHGKRRILRWVAAVAALVIIGAAGAGYLYYRHLNSNLQEGRTQPRRHDGPPRRRPTRRARRR